MDLSRRALLRRGGQAAAGLGATWLLDPLGRPVAPAGPLSAEAERITLRQITNASAAVSPDGRAVVFDLLNMLWTVPVTGGEAVRLTDVVQEATEPDFSPDGRTIVFQSYQDGNFHLFLIGADGTGLTRLTRGRSDHREPRFSPDGGRIAFAAESGGHYGIHVLSLATGEVAEWTRGELEEGQPVWTPDGSAIAFTVAEESTPHAIEVVDARGGRRTLVTVDDGDVVAPTWSPDGKLGYVHRTEAGTSLVVDGKAVSAEEEDVFPFAARWISSGELLYAADGRIRCRVLGGAVRDIDFTAEVEVQTVSLPRSDRDFDSAEDRQVKGIVSPSLSPDGTRVAFHALGDLWLLGEEDEHPRAIVSDGSFNTDPAWSPDGRTIVYASDRHGTLNLWLHDLETGRQRRLTDLAGDERAPAFGPDGVTVAFLSDNAVHTVDARTGELRKVTGKLNLPGRPNFSPDGARLALAGFAPATGRYREGENLVLTIDLATGDLHYTPAVPGRSLGNRVDAGPVHSPDGSRMAFVVDGVLWVSSVDELGRPRPDARRIGDETADAPSWSGDTLLYLSNGRLRRVAAGGGAPRRVPMTLTWRPEKPHGRKVVRAGALWDGRRPELRRDVDIVVQDNRIVEVTAGGQDLGGEVIDARDLTVLPGLVATHEHFPWQRNSTEGRLWLSFGVTSLRSPGSHHYSAVEAKEAQESGRRLGPRLFTAGELIDGSRVYYDTARPITDHEQLHRELERVAELGHDLVKTYVRLPYALQREAIEAGHALGVPAASHYLFGPANLGADGVEHLSATSRYGRNQKGTSTGRAYDDVVKPLVWSGMTLTPTLGLSASTRPALYHHAGWALDDRRLAALLPPQTYEKFRKQVREAMEHRPENALTFVQREVTTMRRVLDGGGHVAVGTDSPIAASGVHYHLNVQCMVRNGITPYEALRAATVEGARALGMSDRIGTVEPGKLADLAFVRGDPLTDIGTAADVRQVMLGGALHTVADLVSPPTPRTAGPSEPVPVHAVRGEVPQGPARDRFWWHRREFQPDRCCC
ncbi:amidohydrolase family protein [Saccharopolyspora taberi]|uniref:Amidohydrolase family protein n=1 Tax=Saccharopolyspora taberi TaxID=60895 RepID=A0ABN3V279_9PSEU